MTIRRFELAAVAGRTHAWRILFVASCLVLSTAPARASDVLQWANSAMNGCWSCSALNQIVQIGLTFAGQAFDALADETANLLALLMGIWILFFAAKMFLPFGPDGGAGSTWNKGAKKLFRFAIVLAFLQSSQLFWNVIFIPLMSSGMALSNAIVTMTDPFETANGLSETGPSANTDQASSQDYCSSGGVGDGVAGAQAVMSQMDCPLAKIQSQFGKGVLVGIAQIWGSVQNAFVARSICAIAGGFFLIGVYFFGMIMYPIFMIDVLMRVTIVTAVAPIALAASMFEPTKRIAEKSLWQLAQAALTLVFVSIVGGIGKASLAYVFANLTLNGVSVGTQGWDDLITMLENQKTASGADFYIDLTTMAYYQLLGIAVIIIFMLRHAGKMAAEFTGVSGGDFSGAMAGIAAGLGSAAYLGGSAAQRSVNGRAGQWGRQNSDNLKKKVAGSGSPSPEQTEEGQ